KAIVTEEQVAHSLIDMSKKKRSTDQFILARRDQTPPDSTTGPSSQPDDDTSEKVIYNKDQGEVDSSTITSGVSIPVSDPIKAHEALAGPDPEPIKEDQTGSDSVKLHVSLAGPNPEHMDDEFIATAYLKAYPRAVVYRDRNNQRKPMRLNELHKFSDGTLTRVMEKLDQMVKDFVIPKA
ncbi:hypothetical protein Tco_0135671, partial [Tanacetum coccineum]